MGKLLQIRVMAQTFRPEDQEKAWPQLLMLAWPEFKRDGYLKGNDKGVLETVQALADQRQFADWPKEVKDALGPGIDKAVALKDKLERALADWKPSEANTLSDDLEDVLREMEAAIPKEHKQKQE